jgi:uncharacterized protein (DUF433 family)
VNALVDKFHDPLLTPGETGHHLLIPRSTMYHWLGNDAAGEPLVHRVTPEKRGWPSVPFIAVVEAYVLRSLRQLNLKMSEIRAAAAAVRREFDTPYGLARKRIATDGIDIFIEYAEDDIRRARDNQQPIREIIRGYLKYITWDTSDEFATRLRLRQYPDVAPVIIDPRFAWGRPVLQSSKIPVEAIVDLWQAGESLDTVGEEYGLTRDQAEGICRAAARRKAS